MNHDLPQVPHVARMVAGVLAAVATLLGATALLGWAIGLEALVDFGSSTSVMTLSVAVAITLLGLTAVSFTLLGPTKWNRVLGLVVASALVVLEATTLVDLIFDLPVGGYRLLPAGPLNESGTIYGSGPSAQATVSLLFISAGLLASLLRRADLRFEVASMLLLLAGTIAGLQVLVASALGAAELGEMIVGGTTSLLWMTALAMVCSGTALLVLVMAPATPALRADPPAWQVLVRLLPFVLAVPLVLTVMAVRYTRGGTGEIVTGIASSALLLAGLVLAVWRTSHDVLRLHHHSLDVITHLPVAAVVVEGDSIVMGNPAAHRLFAGNGEAIPPGTTLASLLDADPQRWSALCRRTTTGKGEATERFSTWSPDAAEVVLEVTMRTTDWETRPALLSIVLDVTDQVHHERYLTEAKDASDSANAAKSEFLSRMSHELRTPLNAVIGFAQIMEAQPQLNQDTESIDAILKAARHLLDLINEVLEISAIEAGHLALSPESVMLDDILGEATSLVSGVAASSGIELLGPPQPGCGIHVLADRQRSMQVLLNLLSNAVKYSNRGDWVQVRCSTPDEHTAQVDVVDSGPGMTEEQLSRLFTPFDRLGKENSTIEGTGIGLALSKRLAEAMGGEISVTSTPGQGSTFSLRLPRAEAPELRATRLNGFALDRPAPQQPSDQQQGGDGQDTESSAPRHSVLLIEDNVANSRLIQRVLDLRPRPLLLHAVGQGRLGVEIARSMCPDLVLLDLHLPDISGEEVLAMLIADPRTATIPVAIISAEARPSHIARLLNAGACHYFTKPIDIEELLRVVDRFLPQEPA